MAAAVQAVRREDPTAGRARPERTYLLEHAVPPVSRRIPVEASCIVTVLLASPKTAVQGEAQMCN